MGIPSLRMRQKYDDLKVLYHFYAVSEKGNVLFL